MDDIPNPGTMGPAELSIDDLAEILRSRDLATINQSQLAQELGVSRPKIQRALKRLGAKAVSKQKLSPRRPSPKPAPVPADIIVDPLPDPPVAQLPAVQAIPVIEQPRETHVEILRPPLRPAARMGSRITACILGLAAIGLGGVGLWVNCAYWSAFAQSGDASVQLAALGICIDVLGLILPLAAINLFIDHRWIAAVGAWVFWVMAIGLTILATSGWSATNLGDAIAGRAATAESAADLREELHRLKVERDAVSEMRSVPEIDARMVAAEGFVGLRVYGRTDGCHSLNGDRVDGLRCAQLTELRQAKARAQQRDEIDREIGSLKSRLENVRPISGDDPGAAMLSQIVPWLTQGRVGLTREEVQRVRIVGLSTVPAGAGLLLGFSGLLWRGRARG